MLHNRICYSELKCKFKRATCCNFKNMVLKCIDGDVVANSAILVFNQFKKLLFILLNKLVTPI